MDKGLLDGFKRQSKELKIDSFAAPEASTKAKKIFEDSWAMNEKMREEDAKNSAKQKSEDKKAIIDSTLNLAPTDLAQKKQATEDAKKDKSLTGDTGKFRSLTDTWRQAQEKLVKGAEKDAIAKQQLAAQQKMQSGILDTNKLLQKIANKDGLVLA